MEKFLLNMNILDYNYIIIENRGIGYVTVKYQKIGQKDDYKDFSNIEVYSEYDIVKTILNGGLGYIGVLRNNTEMAIINLLEVVHYRYKENVHFDDILYGVGNTLCLSIFEFNDGLERLRFPHRDDPKDLHRDLCIANKVFKSGLFVLGGQVYDYKDTTIIIEDSDKRKVYMQVGDGFKEYQGVCFHDGCSYCGELVENLDLDDLPIFNSIEVEDKKVFYNWMNVELLQDEMSFYLKTKDDFVLEIGDVVNEVIGRGVGSNLEGYDESLPDIPYESGVENKSKYLISDLI